MTIEEDDKKKKTEMDTVWTGVDTEEDKGLPVGEGRAAGGNSREWHWVLSKSWSKLFSRITLIKYY